MSEKIYSSDFRRITNVYTEQFKKSTTTQDTIIAVVVFAFVVLLVVAI